MTPKPSPRSAKYPKDSQKIRLEQKAITLLRRSEELRAKAHELIRQSMQ
jgi:hypothetical protein